METVTVYRMETPDGDGAFQAMSWDAYHEFSTRHQINGDDLHFPPPWSDYKLQEDPNWPTVSERASPVFGCCDKDTLKEWFPPNTLDLLTEHGVQFTRWDVPTDAIARSDRQAAFLREKAAVLERLPATALYEPDRQHELPLAA